MEIIGDIEIKFCGYTYDSLVVLPWEDLLKSSYVLSWLQHWGWSLEGAVFSHVADWVHFYQ
jgi:hypothetical protein